MFCASRQSLLDLELTRFYGLELAPSRKRLDSWKYDKALYKRRNVFGNLFRRLKWLLPGVYPLRQADVMFIGVITFALIINGLQLCRHALIVFTVHVADQFYLLTPEP